MYNIGNFRKQELFLMNGNSTAYTLFAHKKDKTEETPYDECILRILLLCLVYNRLRKYTKQVINGNLCSFFTY